MKGKISIIVPAYNAELTLGRCLDSLVNQTYLEKEIVIVNDGSTDRTREIAEKYVNAYSFVHLVNKENEGLPQARKSGLLNSSGDVIGFVDSDDWVESNTYEILLKTMYEYNTDIVCSNYKNVYEDGKCSFETQKSYDRVLSRDQAVQLLLSRKGIFPFMWNKIFRRHLLLDIDYPTGNFIGEDFYTLIQVLKLESLRIGISNEYLFSYWQSVQSMSRGGYSDNHLRSYENYKKAEKLIIEEFGGKYNPSIYLSIEYISFVLAMVKSNKYNYEMKNEIQTYIKSNLLFLIKNKGLSIFDKGCIISFAIAPDVFFYIYKKVKNINITP